MEELDRFFPEPPSTSGQLLMMSFIPKLMFLQKKIQKYQRGERDGLKSKIFGIYASKYNILAYSS